MAYYHCNLGLALSGQRKLDEAVACYRRALALQPDYVEAHNNLGNALLDLGQPDEAVASYRQAIALKPDLAEAHNNLGIALRLQGKTDEAVACFRQAIAVKPDYAEAYSHLGKALRDQGKPDEALGCYRKAIELKPDFVDALNNLALLLMEQGQPIVALNAIKLSLQIKDAAESKRIFVDCVKDLHFTGDDGGIKEFLIRACGRALVPAGQIWRGSAPISSSSTRLIGGCIARAAAAWPRRLAAPELYGPDGLSALAGSELLGALLHSSVIPRHGTGAFSDHGAARPARRHHRCRRFRMTMPPCGSTAPWRRSVSSTSTCSVTPTMKSGKPTDLRDRLAAALDAGTKPVPVLWLLAVAAYVPLSSVPNAARLLDMPWPAPITAILTQQISEPEQERQLRAAMPRLTKIDDEVSRLVRDQYEENPYPRWVKIEPAGDAPQHHPLSQPEISPRGLQARRNKDTTDVLIAGCGTGQQSIGMAQTFKDARILAVDLSLSSLGYAKRKTQELGLPSIDYAQADFLELGSIGRQFDVIASVGVLHHLADPFAGWRVLLSLLRPGGFMNLGFYSELARRHIVKARGFVARRGYAATADDIRRCRQDVLDRRADFGTTTNVLDFYSTSTCRDLLFHAQEHRMTLAGIEAFLRDNGLTFLGFEIDARSCTPTGGVSPTIPPPLDLAQWQASKRDNPDIFVGMYQFWIQKAG